MAARRFPPDVYSGTETVFGALYDCARARHEVRLVAGWSGARERIPAEAVGVRLRGDKVFDEIAAVASEPDESTAYSHCGRAEGDVWVRCSSRWVIKQRLFSSDHVHIIPVEFGR